MPDTTAVIVPAIKIAKCTECGKRHAWDWCADCYMVQERGGWEKVNSYGEQNRNVLITTYVCSCGYINAISIQDDFGDRQVHDPSMCGVDWEARPNNYSLVVDDEEAADPNFDHGNEMINPEANC